MWSTELPLVVRLSSVYDSVKAGTMFSSSLDLMLIYNQVRHLKTVMELMNIGNIVIFSFIKLGPDYVQKASLEEAT